MVHDDCRMTLSAAMAIGPDGDMGECSGDDNQIENQSGCIVRAVAAQIAIDESRQCRQMIRTIKSHHAQIAE